uniref:Uncharacterized protein n=1 Tax=Solanum lycopersicum TaxID=4081 RepID=A0A3Q7F1T6_SOLLC
MELVDRPDKALKYFQEMTLKDIQPAAVVSFYASSIARTIKFPPLRIVEEDDHARLTSMSFVQMLLSGMPILLLTESLWKYRAG